ALRPDHQIDPSCHATELTPRRYPPPPRPDAPSPLGATDLLAAAQPGRPGASSAALLLPGPLLATARRLASEDTQATARGSDGSMERKDRPGTARMAIRLALYLLFG